MKTAAPGKRLVSCAAVVGSVYQDGNLGHSSAPWGQPRPSKHPPLRCVCTRRAYFNMPGEQRGVLCARHKEVSSADFQGLPFGVGFPRLWPRLRGQLLCISWTPYSSALWNNLYAYL